MVHATVILAPKCKGHFLNMKDGDLAGVVDQRDTLVYREFPPFGAIVSPCAVKGWSVRNGLDGKHNSDSDRRGPTSDEISDPNGGLT